MKRLLRHPVSQAVLAWLISAYIRLVWRTSRVTMAGDGPVRAMIEARRPIIVCFWHGRLAMMTMAWPHPHPIKMLSSTHSDSQLIVRVINRFGIGTIFGSTTRGGVGALREILRAVQAGDHVGITPDGPRGPRMRATAGLVVAAKLSGAPLVPISYSATRRVIFRSWDRFLLPLPFGHLRFQVGEPQPVARGADEAAIEAARQGIEDALNALTAEADRLCGHPPVEPAAKPAPASP